MVGAVVGGVKGQNKVVFIPFTPNTVADFRNQIMEAMEVQGGG